jgi:GxxExxY protein
VKRDIVINELTEMVIGSCIKVHSEIGPGCFERVYEEIVCHELAKLNLQVKRQLLLPIDYEELYIKDACKID